MPTFVEIKAADTWLLRHRVMWPDKPFDYVKLEEDEFGRHFGLMENDELRSVVSVFVHGNKAQFRKFATASDHQGRGLGSKLLSFVISKLEEEGIAIIWCNARVEKYAFYQKFGLSTTNQTFTKGGIDYVIMEKKVKAPIPNERTN